MNSNKWIKIWVTPIAIIAFFSSVINFIVDPYGLYNTNIINKPKIKKVNKIRIVNAIKIQEIKPTSVCLGTSRADSGYDTSHKYFTKPAYNVAVPGGTLYENRLYFESLLKNGNLKKVLLVLDFRMLNAMKKNKVSNFETYFNVNKYKYLLSLDTIGDSFLTLKGGGKKGVLYKNNGQRVNDWCQYGVDNNKGHYNFFKNQKNYYQKYLTNYTYKDSGESTFLDFESIVKDSYKNNIKLEIIFGPSHIILWEYLDYHLGYNKWLQWKKDVVLSVNRIANQYNKKQFRIMDFAVYHTLTSEKVPTNKESKMKYHWDSNHYKNELGLIVLDRLVGDSKYKDFGFELNLLNIDEHLKQQEVNRHKFINVEKFQKRVFGKIKK